MADKLEPQQVPDHRRNQVNRARRRGDSEAAQGQGKGKGKSGQGQYSASDFRPYNEQTYQDIFAQRAQRKQAREHFYDRHPYRRHFDPIRDIAEEVEEMLRQVLQLDTEMTWESGHLSGARMHIPKTIRTILQNEVGIFMPDEDFKLFMQKRLPTRVDHKFVLVLDESGSMKGASLPYALQAVALFQHVLDQLLVDFAVVGFSATADIHKDFDESLASEADKDAFMTELESAGGSSTNDLEGINVAADLLADEDAYEQTMIVITDGAGVAETKARVAQLEKEGIRVIAIGVGEGTESVANVYQNYYQSHDFRNLARTLLGILLGRMLGTAA